MQLFFYFLTSPRLHSFGRFTDCFAVSTSDEEQNVLRQIQTDAPAFESSSLDTYSSISWRHFLEALTDTSLAIIPLGGIHDEHERYDGMFTSVVCGELIRFADRGGQWDTAWISLKTNGKELQFDKNTMLTIMSSFYQKAFPVTD